MRNKNKTLTNSSEGCDTLLKDANELIRAICNFLRLLFGLLSKFLWNLLFLTSSIALKFILKLFLNDATMIYSIQYIFSFNEKVSKLLTFNIQLKTKRTNHSSF